MARAFEVFEIAKDAHVATLWLASPERRNAMGPDFWRELPLAMQELGADDEVRAIVIAARGSAFSVGLDLKAMLGAGGGALAPGATPSDAAARLANREQIALLQRSISAVADCRKPVIASVHGWCIGGAVDLITACDIRLAAKDTIFSIRETRIAMVADVGTLQRLPGIIGRGLTAELAFTGADFGAERAREIQLVNHVHEDAQSTHAASIEIARAIAANSPLAVQGTKQVLRFCEGKTIADGLEYVATWNAAFLQSQDLREAVAAFFEKRAPRFTGI